MKKPASLRKAIADAVPGLRRDPDKLLVFSDAGNIVATNTKTLSFEYRYKINLILTDFDGDPNAVMVALLAWVKVNQPDLLDNVDKRPTGISFEVDHLNHKTCDLSLILELTESIRVTTDADGKHTATALDEPVPEWTISGLYGGG